MNLYEAMYARHSVRKYRKEAVEDSVIEGIFRFLDETEPLFPEIRIRIQVLPGGFHGTEGKERDECGICHSADSPLPHFSGCGNLLSGDGWGAQEQSAGGGAFLRDGDGFWIPEGQREKPGVQKAANGRAMCV